ncbi:MAG: class I SAM-dependent methyltransferase [Oligoflexia bacterium]|nr:class I SAM-dependent methyltransferase [Oligoflexia bacterium]
MADLKKIEENMKQVYEENAKAFDQQRGKSLFEKKWLDIFLQTLDTKKEVLDIGCGSGDPIAKYLIENDKQVTGIDFSKAMIELAKEKFSNNEWFVADMRDFDLDRKFDGIIAWNSFFHLNQEDQVKALKVFAKHLKAGGVLMFTAGPEKGEVTGEVNGKPVYHSSLSVEEYRSVLSDLGIELVDYKLNDPDCYQHSVFLGQQINKSV